MTTDAASPAIAPRIAPPRDDAQAAAKQLEAFFLRQLLAEARPRGDGPQGGGFAGDTFKQMFDEAVADKLSAAGGVGLTQMFADELRGRGAAAAPGELPAPGATLAPGALGPGAGPTATLAPGPLPAVRGVGLDPATIDPHGPLGAPRLVSPVIGRPSSGYGLRADPVRGGSVLHAGYDLAAPTGREVSAAAGGTVIHAGPAGTYGNLVTIRHDHGFETRYAHLSEVLVKVGDRLDPGAPLGKVGSTGYSTGPHLHFEVRHDGQAIDPAPLLPLHSSPVRTTR